LSVKYQNEMIWLTVCGDAFGRNRISLAGNYYPLSDLYRLPVFETDAVYGVTNPSVGS
jgi:hypothetical protein